MFFIFSLNELEEKDSVSARYFRRMKFSLLVLIRLTMKWLYFRLMKFALHVLICLTMTHLFKAYDSELFETWAQGYKTLFMLNSVEHEIVNARKYKNIKKFGFF